MKKVVNDTSPTKLHQQSPQPKNLQGNIPAEDKTRIYVRVRPLLHTEEWNNSLRIKDKNNINIIKSDLGSIKMKFDGIFSSDILQKDIFATLQSSIRGFLNGESYSFFAYGQTGAGKTYTMMGDFEESNTDVTSYLTSESRGILPRAFGEILEYIRNKNCRLWAAFYEIYNDKIYDLLNIKSRLKKGGLDFRETPDGYNTIIDLQQLEINTVQDVLNCLRVGIQNRATGSTHANAKSSRSHSIFQLKLVQADPKDPKKTIISQLKIIDLAGSEKFMIARDLTPEEKELRIAELTSINRSLSTLGLCVSALTESKRSHIPFRNSKLTRVLSDTLSGNNKIAFLVCISPSIESSNETLSTLQFASRAKKMVLEGRPNSKHNLKKAQTLSPHNFDHLVNNFRELCLENGLLQEQCDLNTQKKIISIEAEINQLRQENEDLKNELHRLGRSCSPIRYHSEASPGRKVPLKSQNGRSVSPYMSAPKTPKTPEERYSSAKRAPVIEKSEKKRQESPKLKIREKSKEKEEVSSPRKRNQIIRAKTVDNRKTTTPEKDIEEKQIQLLKDLIKMRTEGPNEVINQRREVDPSRKPPLASYDSRKSVKAYKTTTFEKTKGSVSSPSEETSPLSNQKSLHPKQQEPSSHNKSKSVSGTSHKSPTPKTEIQPRTQQTFREPVNQQNEQKNMYQGKGPSDSLQLNEWSGFQDSRFLKDDDQLGVINNQEISAIYPNVLRSYDVTEAEIIFASRSASMKRLELDNNTPHIKETGNQKQTQENVTKQKAKIDHSTEEDDKGRLNTSGDYNSDEVIKEFNKKLLSVHQLNQQHQSLIRNLSAKFGDISSSKKNNSPKSSKSPQNSENKQTRKEVKKVISEIKHEVSTALQQIQSLQSEESHYGNLSGSRGQETHQNAKTSDTSQFNSLQVKSDSQEKDKKQKLLYNREGSTSSLTSTSDNEGPSVKSQSILESKSIMDIITKHWETYKDTIK